MWQFSGYTRDKLGVSDSISIVIIAPIPLCPYLSQMSWRILVHVVVIPITNRAKGRYPTCTTATSSKG